MERVSSSKVLLYANNNNLLCTAIAALISRTDWLGGVDIYEPNQRIDVSTYLLVIIFAVYPISKLKNRLDRLGDVKPKVLLILGTDDKSVARHMGDMDVEGIISIDASYDELMLAIQTIVRKNLRYLSPHIVKSLTKSSMSGDPFLKLSQKELDVALALIRGRRNIEIAKELNISQKTVNTYKSRIYKKLDIGSDILFFRHVLMRGNLFDEGFVLYKD